MKKTSFKLIPIILFATIISIWGIFATQNAHENSLSIAKSINLHAKTKPSSSSSSSSSSSTPVTSNLISSGLPLSVQKVSATDPTSIIGEPSDCWTEVPKLTDGSTTTRCLLYGVCGPDGKLTANSPGFILIYYLGGNAQVSQFKFYNESNTGLQIADLQVYVSSTYSGIFSAGNLIYSTPANTEEQSLIIQSNSTASGKYIAFYIRKPHCATAVGYGIARIMEIQVFGYIQSPNPLYQNPVFTDTNTGIKAEVSILDPDDAFAEAKGILVTPTAFTSNSLDILSNQKMVNTTSNAYKVEIVDQNNIPLSNINGRTMTISIPQPPELLNTFMFMVSQKNNIAYLVPNSWSKNGYVIGPKCSQGEVVAPIKFTSSN